MSAYGQTAPFDGLLQQFDDYYTGAGGDRLAPRVRDAIAAVEYGAEYVTRPGFLNSDGTWSDINYAEVPSGQWSPWDHFRRLTIMARAYRTPGQRFHRNATLRNQIESALNAIPLFYGLNADTKGNWWFRVIGPALDLGPTLVLMRNDIDGALLARSTDILEARIGMYPGFTPTFSILDGQNLVWSALNHYSLALLHRDANRLKWVRDKLQSVTTPQSGEEGMQRDASFHQHGPQLYTGAYGGAFGLELAKYLLLTRGTSYSLEVSGNSTSIDFADYVADGIAWALYHNQFDVSVIGREVVKPWTNGYNGLATLLQMSVVPSPRQTEIARAARKMLTAWTDSLPIEFAALAAGLETGTTRAEWPSGHRHYYVSDYTVHRRPNYFASVKMLSRRTRSGERTNGENLLGSRQSDGRFHLVLRGDEFSGSEAWATMDWSRLPGITVEQRAGAANATYGMGVRSFVGGTGDERNGVSAMDFAATDSALTAKKAWVFLDDAIVFLVNSAKSLSGNRVETIVDQRPLSSLDAPLTIDGALRRITSATLDSTTWIASEGIGYWFPGAENVEMRREMRTGSWAALGGPDQTRTNAMSTIFIDHGLNPANGTAEYVIVPNVAADAMGEWVLSNPITILQNNERGSAVRDNRTGALGVVFWSASSVAGLLSDSPAVVYQTTAGSSMQLSIADPNGGIGSFHVTVPWKLNVVSADPGVVVTSGARSTTLTIPRNGGRTSRVTLKSPGSSRRAVRR